MKTEKEYNELDDERNECEAENVRLRTALEEIRAFLDYDPTEQVVGWQMQELAINALEGEK